MSVSRSLLLAGLVVVIAAGTVQAQQIGSQTEVSFSLPSAIAPGSTYEGEANVTYSWEDGGLSTGPTQVDVNHSIPFSPLEAWAQVTVEPDTLTYQTGPQSGSSTQQVNVTITLDEDAPAFVAAPMTIRAQAQQNAPIQASNGSDSADVVPRLVPSVQVQAPGQVEFSGEGTVEVSLSNTGNGPVRVAVSDLQAPDGVEATPPSAIVLGPGGPAGDNADSLDVPSALRDAYGQPSTGTLTIAVSGSGDGALTFNVTYGPPSGQTGQSAGTVQSVRVAAGGLPILPILALFVLAAAIGGGYYVWSNREADSPPPGSDVHREPILVPIDDEGNVLETDEYEGEEWVDIEDDTATEGAAEAATSEEE